MNEKNIDNLFRTTNIGDLFYVKEIALAKLFNIKNVNFIDEISPFKLIIAFVTDINESEITLFSCQNEILKFSKQELLDYNLLEKI